MTLHIGPVAPVSQADFNAIIRADRAVEAPNAGVRDDQTSDEDRVVDTIPAVLPKVPQSFLSRHQSQTTETHAPSIESDEVVGEKWVRAAQKDVKKARIHNRANRVMVDPLPSTSHAERSPGSPDAAESENRVAAPIPELVELRTSPPENSADGTVVDAVETPVKAEPKAPMTPIGFPLATDPEWDEPLVPSILPSFDYHLDHADDRPVRRLRLIHGLGNQRSEPAGWLLENDDPDEDDIVVHSNGFANDRAFELPPAVDETFHLPVQREDETRELERTRPRRKRASATAFGTRWSAARERPRQPGADAIHLGQERLSPSQAEIEVQTSAVDEVITTFHVEDTDAMAPLLPQEDAAETNAVAVPTEELTGEVPFFLDQLQPDSEEAALSWVHAEQAPPVAARLVLDSRRDTSFDEQPGVDDVVVRNIGAGPLSYDAGIDEYVIAPEVPRMCRTCSAFRPFEDGERGWCSNGWAFGTQSIVQSWDLPCQTSFGNWWIPDDGCWIDGVSERHAAPTPLYDRLMASKAPSRKERSRKRWS